MLLNFSEKFLSHPFESRPGYRRDIDGLGALAVCAVLVYHSFPQYMRGGFIGVDIFFVISGFLISGIIFSGLENNSFSFRDFYFRRIRRIFPALLCVLIFCLIAGYFVLLPDEYKQLGKHTGSGSIYLSNFTLRFESGYFDNAATTKPLLHLWSLAIEEQFYIFWPLILWLAWRCKINIFVIVLLTTVCSILLCDHFLRHEEATIAFYMPWNRAWELTVGSLLAWLDKFLWGAPKGGVYRSSSVPAHSLLQDPNFTRKVLTNLISWIGLILLMIGLWHIDPKLPYPSKWTLLPVLGTSLIILGKGAIVNKLFSNRILVFIGLISYPLYLWHWPLLSMAEIVQSGVPQWWILLVASL